MNLIPKFLYYIVPDYIEKEIENLKQHQGEIGNVKIPNIG